MGLKENSRYGDLHVTVANRLVTADAAPHIKGMSVDLTGKLLLAMPGIGDDRFDQAVIFMVSHTDEGAMGLVINKPATDVDFSDLLDQVGIETDTHTDSTQVYLGGPVEIGRGFVLHSPEYSDDVSTLQVDDAFGMTATLDVLDDMAAGQGPKSGLLALGYSGWGAGQLEDEIMANGWLMCPASHDLVFHLPDEGKWTGAMKSIGIDPLHLSSEVGRA